VTVVLKVFKLILSWPEAVAQWLSNQLLTLGARVRIKPSLGNRRKSPRNKVDSLKGVLSPKHCLQWLR